MVAPVGRVDPDPQADGVHAVVLEDLQRIALNAIIIVIFGAQLSERGREDRSAPRMGTAAGAVSLGWDGREVEFIILG